VAIDNEFAFHYLVWTFALIVLTLCLNLVRTGVGRGLAALAQDEEAAACLGVDVRWNKVRVFILSAVLASLAGSLLVHKKEANVSPDFFTIFKSLDLVIMVVVGGLGSVWGTLLGVTVVVLLPHLLGTLETYYDLVHGLILVLILMFLPQGLVTGLFDHLRMRLARRRLAGGSDPGH
jgi:branched-chain amino acid transport system permease protein